MNQAGSSRVELTAQGAEETTSVHVSHVLGGGGYDVAVGAEGETLSAEGGLDGDQFAILCNGEALCALHCTVNPNAL